MVAAVYQKFNLFTQDLATAKHDFSAHTYKVMLTNVLPLATNAVKADITEIGAGSGYAAGGPVSAVTLSNVSGVEKATFADVTITALAGTIGPFRYAVWYNDTQSSPVKPLVGYADYGSNLSLISGASLVVDFDGSAGLFTIT